MPEISARPTVTKEMILAAATVVAAKIDGDAETIADYYQLGMDGWELAKALDQNAYWDTSREDMEALDEVDYLVRSALTEAEKQWFADGNIQPPHPIGTRLLCFDDKSPGEITAISDYAPACYEVKPDGQDDETSGHRRWIIRFENAVAA